MRRPPGTARSARARDDYSPGIGQFATPFVLPFMSPRLWIKNRIFKNQTFSRTLLNIVQNFGAVMAESNLAVAEIKTRSAPGFFYDNSIPEPPVSNATGPAISCVRGAVW